MRKVLILLRAVLQSIPNAWFRCVFWPIFWPAWRVALWCCPHLLLYSGCQEFFGGFDSSRQGFAAACLYSSDMQTRTLSTTRLTVSRACLGTMTFGSETDQSMASRIVDVCLDRGMNFFDSANVYNFGRAEAMLGTLLKGRRHGVVVASKVGMKMGDGAEESGLSYGAILKNIDDSLRRLQSDYIDICYLHRPDNLVPVEETLRAIEDLINVGKLRYLGFSNYAAWQACRMLWLCHANSYQAPLISQPMYNLLARGVEQEFVPFCQEFNVAMVVYNPLARGLLAGTSSSRPPIADSGIEDHQLSLNRYHHPGYFKAVDELQVIAQNSGRSLLDISLNWLLHHTLTDCVILGAPNVQQIEQNLDVLDHGPLLEETVAGCDLVWQGLRAVTPQYNR
jgi:1-deoxyxylulose-5-phosphate synthase